MRRIQTDRGVNFESELVKHLLKLMKIDKSSSTPYHPTSNGQIERLNKTIKQVLSCYVNKKHDDWDQHLQAIIFVYNTAVNESTKTSPFEAIFGYPAKLAFDPKYNPTSKHFVNYPESIKQNLGIIHGVVRRNSDSEYAETNRRPNQT